MKTEITSAVAPIFLLDEANTQLFIKEMDILCKNLDFKGIRKIFKKYPLENFDRNEAFKFQIETFNIYRSMDEEYKGFVIKKVEPFDSRCIACSFGKHVKAYHVEYNKNIENNLPYQYTYQLHFAISFVIKENKLVDFMWCNLFLKRSEMKELN
jgi:hypothetical protein